MMRPKSRLTDFMNVILVKLQACWATIYSRILEIKEELILQVDSWFPNPTDWWAECKKIFRIIRSSDMENTYHHIVYSRIWDFIGGFLTQKKSKIFCYRKNFKNVCFRCTVLCLNVVERHLENLKLPVWWAKCIITLSSAALFLTAAYWSFCYPEIQPIYCHFISTL